MQWNTNHNTNSKFAATMTLSVVICFLFINFAVEYEPQHKLIVCKKLLFSELHRFVFKKKNRGEAISRYRFFTVFFNPIFLLRKAQVELQQASVEPGLCLRISLSH